MRSLVTFLSLTESFWAVLALVQGTVLQTGLCEIHRYYLEILKEQELGKKNLSPVPYGGSFHEWNSRPGRINLLSLCVQRGESARTPDTMHGHSTAGFPPVIPCPPLPASVSNSFLHFHHGQYDCF